uniref:SCP domain-containing protein n=1 Tax=Mesocestoides corti TaxID=53468 RepID=A0A5K3FU35_MESCO
MRKLFSLLAMIWLSTAQPPTNEERKTINDYHLELRENVSPTATNMLLMNYSVELEESVRKWISRCELEEPNASAGAEFENTGMTIHGYSPNKPDYKMELSFYATGARYYNIDNNTCSQNCDDYKRMVWSNSTEVGCSIQQCNNTRKSGSDYFIMACLYRPGKNEPIERPYEKGDSCTKCPSGFTCYRNQCKNVSIPVTTTSASTLSYTMASAIEVLLFVLFSIC